MTRHGTCGTFARCVRGLALGLLLASGLAVLVVAPAEGQQIHRDPHEARDTVWVKGPSDASPRELAHAITDQVQHTGQSCELLQLECDAGSYIHYHYDTGRAPIGEDLSAGVWVKANRPGIQLFARLVIPNERAGNNTQQPLTAIVRGDVYQTTGRWSKLSIPQPVKQAKQQQQVLRGELNRDVNMTDAYLDRLILNVYGGPGPTEVLIDDLEIGPVLETRPLTPDTPPSGSQLMTRPGKTRSSVLVKVEGDQLKVGDKRFFFRAIRHTDTPLKVLRDAGFNTIWLDEGATSAQVAEAVNLGFWVVPSLSVGPGSTADAGGSPDTFLTSNPVLGKTVSRFLEQDGVLFWDLGGGGLAVEQENAVASTARLVHSLDPQRPLAADVWDGFRPYSRQVNLLGVHRWPLMTGLEMSNYRDWLTQRRQLANPDTFLWTWVQTHLPDWHTAMVYGQSPQAGFNEPVGPLPEQIRLLTYTALASGCRGLGFWSDRFLADSHQGRDRLLELALLNQEIQMLEPLLVGAEKPAWVETSSPDVKAAVFRQPPGGEKATLVVPVWIGFGAQYVPGQAARANLSMTIPQVPVGTQAWEVSPGDVRSLKQERVAGGTKITLDEFGLTSAIIFTADNGPDGLLVHLQDQSRRMRKLAAQWTHDLAVTEFDKVTRVHNELEAMGKTLPDGQALLEDARKRVDVCVRQWSEGNYREAYLEGQRALRPLGILMRAHWEEAVKGLDTPVASPYAVSYFTLPRHWKFAEQLLASRPAANVLPHGGFEAAPAEPNEAWTPQEITLDEVELEARRVAEGAHEGQQCLKLTIKPKDPLKPPAALERTYLALHSPAVRLPGGSLVKISGWARMENPIGASADGALMFDSAGGEPLAIRLTKPLKKWHPFTWYRKVPESGRLNVSLALTGLGSVYFDELKIELMQPGAAMPVEGERGLRSPKVKDDEKEEHKPGQPATSNKLVKPAPSQPR